MTVGANSVPFNREATWWLGIWLDSQLSLKEHHAIRMEEDRKAMTRLRRLTGQMGLSPAASQLQESHDGMRLVSNHVQCRAVVERGLRHGHPRSGGGDSAAGQPGGSGDNGMLPDDQPGGPLSRIRIQT